MQADGLIVEDAAPDGIPKMRARAARHRLSDTGKQRFAELVADTGPQNYSDDGFGVHLALLQPHAGRGQDADLGGAPSPGGRTP